MKMIEISREKKHKMSELVEDCLKSMGKLMNCLESLSEEETDEYEMKYGRYGTMSHKKHNRYDEDEYGDEEYHRKKF